MEAFGDAVASTKAPHAAGLGLPLVECFAQRLQRRETALTQAFDVAEQRPCQRPARPGVTVVQEQELTKAFPHFVQNAGGGLLLEIARQALALFGAEVFGMPPQQ